MRDASDDVTSLKFHWAHGHKKASQCSWWTPWWLDLNALSIKGLLRSILLFSDFGNLSTMIKGIDIEGDQMNGHKWKRMEIKEMHGHERKWKERKLKAGQAICKGCWAKNVGPLYCYALCVPVLIRSSYLVCYPFGKSHFRITDRVRVMSRVRASHSFSHTLQIPSLATVENEGSVVNRH